MRIGVKQLANKLKWTRRNARHANCAMGAALAAILKGWELRLKPLPHIALATLLAASLIALPARADTGVAADFAYTVDVLNNASGGLRRGTSLPQNISAVFEFDMEQWTGLREGIVSAHVLWNDATTFSDRYVGDTQVVSNIDSIQALRLFELWYETDLSNAINFRFGLYNLNSEFDAIETAGLFLNSSHGIGKEYSQTGVAGPSIFPSTSLAARLNWQMDDRTALRYALLDGVPGDPNDPAATRIDLGGSDGYLHALELNYKITDSIRLGLGGFLYTADFETILQPAIPMGSGPQRSNSNDGVYLFADAPVFADDKRQVSAFVRLGQADQGLNPVKSYFGAGLVATGLFSHRPQDQLGLAVATARIGDDIRSTMPLDSHETTYELTYSAQINRWLRIQPDIQYVINPGADGSLKNALVFGLRLQATSQLTFN